MKKIINKNGFTLVETLCAILLLILVTSLMISGMQYSVNNFSTSMSFSQAQVLSKTLSTAVSDELRYAQNPIVDEATGQVRFTSPSFGSGNNPEDDGISFNIQNGKIYLGENKLISDASYTNGNKADIKVEYIGKKYCVFLTVMNSNGEVLRTNNFEVVPINEKDYMSGTNITE